MLLCRISRKATDQKKNVMKSLELNLEVCMVTASIMLVLDYIFSNAFTVKIYKKLAKYLQLAQAKVALIPTTHNGKYNLNIS